MLVQSQNKDSRTMTIVPVLLLFVLAHYKSNTHLLYSLILIISAFTHKDTLEIQCDALKTGQKVVILDDLMATGGR